MRRRLALLAAAACAAAWTPGALAGTAPPPAPPPAAGTATAPGETAVELSGKDGTVGTGTILVLALLLGLFWIVLRRWRPPGGEPARRRRR